MARARSSRSRQLFVLVAAAVLAVGCSGGQPAETVSADAPIVLQISPNSVAFENRSGVPFTDVELAILPYGPGEFTRRFGRIENTGKRQVPLSEFRGRDGTPLNLRVVRPKTVRVRAEDLAGKSYETQMAWK